MKLKRTDTFIENDITVNGVTVGIVELNPDKQEISRLIIYEPYQNKGYGTEVIKELIDKGYTSLWVKSDNERAIHIYEKCYESF